LKPKGYLKSTTTSIGKIYQPKFSQVNTKILVEEPTPQENFKQAPSAEASTSKPEVRFENPEEVVPKIKTEVDSTNTPKGQNERSLLIPIVVNIMSTSSFPEVKFPALRNPEEHFVYLIHPLLALLFIYLVSPRKPVHVSLFSSSILFIS
jgi:hypothetical protein